MTNTNLYRKPVWSLWKACGAVLLLVMGTAASAQSPPQTLPKTTSLKIEGDITSELVAGVDRFLLKQLDASVSKRAEYWKDIDNSSPQAYAKSVQANRDRLARILGLRDQRISFESLELVSTLQQPAEIARTESFRVLQVRWPVVGDIFADGLLLEPISGIAVGNVVALGDADQTPEQLVGLQPGVDATSQFARRLAESGCRVLVPTLIDRTMQRRRGRANLTSREYLYRSAFELGRHLIGYEVAAVQSGVDWFKNTYPDKRVGVIGWGEGGMLSLYASAVDQRIDAAVVSGFFSPREGMWDEPIDRNVFGILERFGAAELTLLVSPRPLVIEVSRWPEVSLPSEGGAPATLKTPTVEEVRREFNRIPDYRQAPNPSTQLFVPTEDGKSGPGHNTTLSRLLHLLRPGTKLKNLQAAPKPLRKDYQARERQAEMIHAIDRHNQYLLRESSYVRAEFMKGLDTSTEETYATTVEKYREIFRDEVVGRFDIERLPSNPRTRLSFETPKWHGYDVVLDVFPDVIAYGVLLVPNNIPEGERRPVVVCQHGLEGRPRDTIEGNHRAYHDFAAKLAERGFVTFAPQNLYIFKDRFRTLQRKANPLKKTLFSVIVPQHQQITDWLKTLPYVDGDRIGFYGLSYGGKSAMRIPPLVSNYCLSICSADFNEWVWKNASTRANYSYVWTGEYEIFEFDLGSTFNYSEMAALIAPRPFMVERGHFDGVGPDEKVAHEFAKVRRLYNTGLKMPDRAEIEWFVGPHTINGKGTFRFLHKHLSWPEPGK